MNIDPFEKSFFFPPSYSNLSVFSFLSIQEYTAIYGEKLDF
jgi:hypothetical protein